MFLNGRGGSEELLIFRQFISEAIRGLCQRDSWKTFNKSAAENNSNRLKPSTLNALRVHNFKQMTFCFRGSNFGQMEVFEGEQKIIFAIFWQTEKFEEKFGCDRFYSSLILMVFMFLWWFWFGFVSLEGGGRSFVFN